LEILFAVVLVALFIDRVGAYDGQEACINLERGVFLDEGRFSVVDIVQRLSVGSRYCTDLTAWILEMLEYLRHPSGWCT
jgi:hypothetical protein